MAASIPAQPDPAETIEEVREKLRITLRRVSTEGKRVRSHSQLYKLMERLKNVKASQVNSNGNGHLPEDDESIGLTD